MIINTQRRIVNLWYGITLIFLFCCFLPSLLGIDGMEGGFAIMTLSGFLTMTGIIVILVYRSRARLVDKILDGEGRIAQWKYSPDEWYKFIERDFDEEKKAKKNLFYLVAAISVLIGFILMILVKDPLILLIILGIIAMIAIPAFAAPRYRMRKLKNSEAEVLLARDGLIVGKMIHLWIKMGARLDLVLLDNTTDPNIVEFHYSMPSRTGRQEEVARVPVPAGRMEEAMKIITWYNESYISSRS